MEKTITIDDKQVTFKATGNTVRLYRQEFGRDLIIDIEQLQTEYAKEDFSKVSLETFENLCYIMAKQADSAIPSIDEWYDGFNTFSIYMILPQILELWNTSSATNENVIEKKSNAEASAD